MLRILKDGIIRNTTAITPVHQAMLLIYLATDWTNRFRAVRSCLRGGWGADIEGSKSRLIIIVVHRWARLLVSLRILFCGHVWLYVREGQIEEQTEHCYLVTGLAIGRPVAW